MARAAGLVAFLVAAALSACGRGGTADLPAACHFTNGPRTVQTALAKAPGEVRIEGTTPISHCLPREAATADIQSVGAALVTVASGLADTVRTQPHGRAATQLGYLVGAVRRGASKTAGIHYELERRVEEEANGIAGRSPEYLAGQRAGEASG